MKGAAIEKEVLSATAEDAQQDGESRKEYLSRLTKAASKLDEDSWKSLSEDTQVWVNGAIKSIKNKKAPKDFPGADAAADDANGSDKPKGKKKASASKTDPDAAPAKSKSKGKSKRGDGTAPIPFLRRYVCEHPDMDRDKVRAAVEKKVGAMKDGTFTIAYYDTHKVLNILKDLGKLKG